MSGSATRPADAVEGRIEAALAPGRFVSDRACFSFVGGLEAVEREIADLVEVAPGRAVALYEAYLAGCHEKADEVDDSSGSLGMFVTSLCCGWVQARQAAGAAADETATRLLEWMDDDPFGFCYRLERDVAKVLDEAGLAALASQVRTRLDKVSTAGAEAGSDESLERDPARRRLAEVLRTLYRQQADLEAYLGLAQQTGLTAADCHAVAVMLAARGAPGQALSWVERGIELDSTAPHSSFSGHELAALKPCLLKELGRDREALEVVWARYRQQPSRYSYDDLMQLVPSPERARWHERAIRAAMAADLSSLIGLLCETGEIDRLAEVVRGSSDDALETVSHYVLEPAATRLEETNPGVAARLWRAVGMRVVNAGKSKYYDAATRSLARARRCYEQAGLTADWQQVVSLVRGRHHRKTGFMPGFEAMVEGSGDGVEPSFLERAKARWSRPAGPLS